VIPMLVSNARTFGVEFDMNTISICRWSEKLLGCGDHGGERILGVMDTFRASECTGGILSYKETLASLTAVHTIRHTKIYFFFQMRI
jgi:hypothetical protein